MKAASKKRRWPWVILTIGILLVVLLIAAGNLLVDYAINRQASFSMSNSFSQYAGQLSDDQKWLLSVGEDWYGEHVGSGEKIHAYYVQHPEANGKYAVLFHGYGSSSLGVINFIMHYYEQGYNLLIPDAYAHGSSEGQYIGMGWPERMDAVHWIERLTQQDPEAKIVLHGISMGGATVMMVSGEKLPENVKAIVEDCGYTSVWDEFSWQMKRIFHLPSFPLLDMADLFAQLRAGYSFRDASAVSQVAKSVTPTLFIHGSEDTFVPFEMLEPVYEAAACEKEKLVVEGASHGASSWNQPELYWSAVDDFIARHMD